MVGRPIISKPVPFTYLDAEPIHTPDFIKCGPIHILSFEFSYLFGHLEDL